MRRMVRAPDEDRGGGASKGLGVWSGACRKYGRLSEMSASDESEAGLVTASRTGGTAVSELCNWQQSRDIITAESQSVIIALQQE